MADRTQTVATALLGLTFECCRCHNHKYDPLTQSEYYQLSAFFDNIDEAGLYSFFTQSVPTPTLSLPTAEQEASLKRLSEAAVGAQQKLLDAIDERTPAAVQWVAQAEQIDESEFFAKPIASLDFENDIKPPNQSVPGVIGKAIQLTGDDAVGTKVGNFRRFDPFSVSLWIKTPNVKDRAVVFHRSRAWTDAASRGYQLLVEDGKLSWSLIHFWPGNAISIRTVDTIPIDEWLHVAVASDGSSKAEGLAIYLNGKRAETEISRNSLTKNITGGGGDNVAIGERFRDRGFSGGSVDEFRVFDCKLTELEIDRLANRDSSPWIDEIGSLESGKRVALTRHYLLRHDTVIQTRLSELRKAREQLCRVQDALQEIMVMREQETPRQTFFLNRGAYDNRGEPVQPETPAALGTLPAAAPRNRLGFAHWLTGPIIR